MSGPSEFAFGAPPIAATGRPDLFSSAEMMNFGSFLPPGSGQPAAFQPQYRLRNRHLARKRHSSPAGGPARKRRAAEERMIGDLENLSLTSMQARQSKSRFERWQELEARLAAEPPDEDEQDENNSDSPRIVISNELQEIMSSPAPDVIPDVKSASPCTALVLWQPPPTSPSEPAGDETPEPTPEPPAAVPPATPDEDMLPPPATTPAYDFSPFCQPGAAGAAEQPQTFLFGAGGAPVQSSPSWPAPGTAAFQFGAPVAAPAAPIAAPFAATFAAAPAATAAARFTASTPFAGPGFNCPLPADDESMEL